MLVVSNMSVSGLELNREQVNNVLNARCSSVLELCVEKLRLVGFYCSSVWPMVSLVTID